MTCLLKYFCLISAVLGYCTAALICGENEIEVACPIIDGEWDSCPTSRQVVFPPIAKGCLPPTCKCQFNYRRDKNNKCIPIEKCPAFACTGKNEIFMSCPSFCEDTCGSIDASGECFYTGFFFPVFECSPKCRCRLNFARKNGVCVPFAQCKD